MAQAPNQSVLPAWLTVFDRYKPLLVPVAVIGMIAVIVVPLPPVIMDLLIAANIAIASLILMTTIFVKSPLEFSVFPSVLLGTTLLRLVLNIATTRLILSNEADSAAEATASAGKVIEAFAEFVSGSSVVVGVILFLILIIVQFVVITKGATRISEVAARFTLDGMPGKQMAIDADLNAGLIDEQTARKRREEIGREADFYGAMDGAAKFVRGDAIAGIIITLVNIVGGFAVGVAMNGMPVGEAVDVYTRLTIGDGLVSQLPAFVISIAAALIVTRSGSREDLGLELAGQLASRSAALWITAGFLAAMSVTGLPTIPMLALGLIVGVVAWSAGRHEKQAKHVEAKTAKEETKPDPAPIEQALHVDTMELEVGYALVQLVDTSQGGDLLERITMIRRTLAAEQGLVMPPVRIRDNMQLGPNEYNIKIRGNAVASGQVFPGQYLAMDGGLADPDAEPLPGVRTREPAFGLDAVWIQANLRDQAEQMQYTAVDATSVLSTHLTEVVKNHAHELLDYEETTNLITQLREKAPKLCEAVLGPAGTQTEAPLIKPNELQTVLQNLLRERVPIRDLATIVETLGQWGTRTKDLDVLTEYVRNELRRTICTQYSVSEPGLDDAGLALGPTITKLYCVSLDPALEDLINGYIERSEQGTSLSMPPAVANRVTAALLEECNTLMNAGRRPVVLTSPQVRGQVRRLIEPHLPTCAVLGYNEVSKGVDVESLGLVQLPQEPSARNAAGPGESPERDAFGAVDQDAGFAGSGLDAAGVRV